MKVFLFAYLIKVHIGICCEHFTEKSLVAFDSCTYDKVSYNLGERYLYFLGFCAPWKWICGGIVAGIAHQLNCPFRGLFIQLWSNPHVATQNWRWLLIEEKYINFNAENERKRSKRFIIPIIRDILFDIFFTCELHVRFLLIVNPMKLNSLTLSICIFPIFSLGTSLSTMPLWW